MKHIFCNQLKYNRIKALVLGGILMIGLLVYVALISRGLQLGLIYLSVYYFLLFGFLVIIGRIPFGQVIVCSEKKEFIIYFKVGSLKFKQQKWSNAQVILEQDQKRFYCLIIRTAEGMFLQIEKHPTLKNAQERLNDFRKLSDSNDK